MNGLYLRFGIALVTGLLTIKCVVAGDIPLLAAINYHGEKYAVSWRMDPAKEDLRLYWADSSGGVLGNFAALQEQVAKDGGRLAFAANAGMFDTTSKPVGLLVQNGETKFPLNLKDGPGNFYMKPNGVFLINERHHALIVKSEDYPAVALPALWATQSGPLLLQAGDINPDFMPDSKNRKIRSGVGVTKQGEVIFALSKQLVTFYEFAELFRTKLHCIDALYLDGDISDFWTPDLVEQKDQHHFGPMFGMTWSIPQEGVTAPPAAP